MRSQHFFLNLGLFGILLFFITASRTLMASSVPEAEEALSEAYNTYYQALRSGKGQTTEQRETFRKTTVDRANQKMSEALTQQTQQLREEESERQRANTEAFQRRTSHLGSSQKTRSPTEDTSSTFSPSRRNSIPLPEADPIVIDGSSAPKQLVFPGKTSKKPHQKK